jgi:hypothetical protein
MSNSAILLGVGGGKNVVSDDTLVELVAGASSLAVAT